MCHVPSFVLHQYYKWIDYSASDEKSLVIGGDKVEAILWYLP
jgi:hypothetical protein